MRSNLGSSIVLTCAVLTAFLASGGCAKKVAPDAEINTVAYYVEHNEERTEAAKACRAYMDGPYTALSADDRVVARKSNWMTNCSNVGDAIAAAYQKRLREAAAKYSK